MFDIRYHALSLAAVLIALMVGLLLGVAIGDANLVSSAEQGVSSSLRRDISSSQRDNAKLARQLALRRRYESLTYPTLAANQLPGKRIGLIFLGSADDRYNSLVNAALVQTGAAVGVVAVVREPPDLPGLGAAAASTRYGQLDRQVALVRPFGERLGLQLAAGSPAGAGGLLKHEQRALFSSSSGALTRLDGIVVVRDAGALHGRSRTASDQLDAGLMSGLIAGNIPVVGVEQTSTKLSQVTWYRQQNMASVDDLDDMSGRLALVFALAGAHGAYGQKPSAEALLPKGTPGLR